MNQPFEQKYSDVLQNIEAAIVSVYNEHPEMNDWNVERTLNSAIQVYRSEERGRSGPPLKLNELERALFDRVKYVCDWRMGREDASGAPNVGEIVSPKSVEEIIACLKRIEKSVRFWTKQSGRQGYLNYIVNFIG